MDDVADNEIGIAWPDLRWPNGRNVNASEIAVGICVGHFLKDMLKQQCM
jgi:hypothetical protein